MRNTESANDTWTKLTLINERARREPQCQFNNLAHLLNELRDWGHVLTINKWLDMAEPDIVAAETGRVFVAETPEEFNYDADGNLLRDGRFNYTWDAENRLIRRGIGVTSELITNETSGE